MTSGCMSWLQKRMHPEDATGVRTTVLLLTEVVRWLAFVVPIYLATWRWAQIKGFTLYFEEDRVRADFWAIVTIIFFSSSLLIYVPLKLFCVKFLGQARNKWGWRPSILQYILLCALPSLTIILYATQTRPETEVMTRMDDDSMIAIQMTILGLTITEWMAKLREEVLTYDLVTAMAADFFFAYDVIDFVMMLYHDEDVFQTNWIYVTFTFTFIAMFKYLPSTPTSIFDEKEVPKETIRSILVTMFCQDIPFVVVRVTTMTLYGYAASDLIHPAKNAALIVFGLTQIYIIYKNHRTMRDDSKLEFEERRKSRFNGRERFIEVVNAVTSDLQAQKVGEGPSRRTNIQMNEQNNLYPNIENTGHF